MNSVLDRLKYLKESCRRYFYPLISTFSPYSTYVSANPANLPVATKMADSVICLPMMHHALTDKDVERVINIII